MRAYRSRAAIRLSRLRRIARATAGYPGRRPTRAELIEVVVGEMTRVVQSASQHAPENLPVLEAGDDRADHRSLDASRHQAGDATRSLEAAGEVVGVEGDDAAHALAEVDGRRQRDRRADGLTRQREVGKVELLDDP